MSAPATSPSPEVSVITICRNNRDGLERTLTSIWAQESRGIELVVVDGGSDDGTRGFLESNSHRIHSWQSEPDGGVFDAQNRGLCRARGRFVLFLNSGDRFASNQSVELLLAAAQGGADIVYGDMVVEGDGSVPWRKIHPRAVSPAYLYIDSLSHCSTLIRRELLVRIGGYDDSLDIVADWRFWIEACVLENVRVVQVPHAVSIFAWGGVSSSERLRRRQFWERRQVWTALFPGSVMLPGWVVAFVLARQHARLGRWLRPCVESMLQGRLLGPASAPRARVRAGRETVV